MIKSKKNLLDRKLKTTNYSRRPDVVLFRVKRRSSDNNSLVFVISTSETKGIR